MMMTILLVIIEIKVYVKDLNQSIGLCMMASQLVGCLVAFFLLLSSKNFMVLSNITPPNLIKLFVLPFQLINLTCNGVCKKLKDNSTMNKGLHTRLIHVHVASAINVVHKFKCAPACV